ncbi:hypothetical protein Tco_1367903 [Tanacetum coccineum]
MHVHFWNICSDEKGRVAWSESKSIHNDLKCGFSLYLSRIESSVTFPNVKSFLLWNKFKIKFGLLSRYELHITVGSSAERFKFPEDMLLKPSFLIKKLNLSRGKGLVKMSASWHKAIALLLSQYRGILLN